MVSDMIISFKGQNPPFLSFTLVKRVPRLMIASFDLPRESLPVLFGVSAPRGSYLTVPALTYSIRLGIHFLISNTWGCVGQQVVPFIVSTLTPRSSCDCTIKALVVYKYKTISSEI